MPRVGPYTACHPTKAKGTASGQLVGNVVRDPSNSVIREDREERVPLKALLQGPGRICVEILQPPEEAPAVSRGAGQDKHSRKEKQTGPAEPGPASGDRRHPGAGPPPRKPPEGPVRITVSADGAPGTVRHPARPAVQSSPPKARTDKQDLES